MSKKKGIKKILILYGIIFFSACAPHFPIDPNANTVVTYQYDGGPVNIVFQDEHRSPIDCSKKTVAQCAIALYIDSESYIDTAKTLVSKKLYMSATLEYLQALTRLSLAKIKATKAKLNNYAEYQHIVRYDLENKIKVRHKYCSSQIERLKWLR